MAIYMLAAAMMFAMLIGTFIALHEEASRVKIEARTSRREGFNHRSRL